MGQTCYIAGCLPNATIVQANVTDKMLRNTFQIFDTRALYILDIISNWNLGSPAAKEVSASISLPNNKVRWRTRTHLLKVEFWNWHSLRRRTHLLHGGPPSHFSFCCRQTSHLLNECQSKSTGTGVTTHATTERLRDSAILPPDRRLTTRRAESEEASCKGI